MGKNQPSFRFLFISNSIFLLSGCAVGPNYRPPSDLRPSAFGRSIEFLSVDPEGAQILSSGRDVPARWWESFQNSTLNKLVGRGLSHSPTLAAARDALRASQENVLAQYSGLLPSVAGQAAWTREKYPYAQNGIPNSSGTWGYYDLHLTFSYNIDVWGGVRRGVERQAALRDGVEAQLQSAYLVLTANIVSTAINTAMLQRAMAEQQRLVGFETEYLKTIEAQYAVGAASATDVALQRTQVAEQSALVPTFRARLFNARHALADLVGALPADEAISPIDLDGLTLPAELPIGIPSDLLEHRPDIRQAASDLHAATAAVGIAEAARLPTFVISGAWGDVASHAAEFAVPGNGMAALAAQIAQPVFQGGRLLHNQRAAEATLSASAEHWRAVVYAAFHNVADILAQIAADKDAFDADLQAERAASTAMSLAQTQYGLGGISYLTVLTAETAYQRTLIALIEAKAARLSDSAALFVSLGGGWWRRHDDPILPDRILPLDGSISR